MVNMAEKFRFGIVGCGVIGPVHALADGTVVSAGEGLARWPEILQQLHTDGYEGFFSLEPHLAIAGQYQGFSSPDLFHHASQALQQLLQSMDWKYE
jgi:3-dehydroshikimate dehydratase